MSFQTLLLLPVALTKLAFRLPTSTLERRAARTGWETQALALEGEH